MKIKFKLTPLGDLMFSFKNFADVLASNGGSILVLGWLFLCCLGAYTLLHDITIRDFCLMLLGALLGIIKGEIRPFPFITTTNTTATQDKSGTTTESDTETTVK
jgi:hypothetical protein